MCVGIPYQNLTRMWIVERLSREKAGREDPP